MKWLTGDIVKQVSFACLQHTKHVAASGPLHSFPVLQRSSHLTPFLHSLTTLSKSAYHCDPAFSSQHASAANILEAYLRRVIPKFYFTVVRSCSGSSLLRGLFSAHGAQASHCPGFPCCGAWAPGCAGFSSCGVWTQFLQLPTLEHRLSSCSTWA